MKQKLNCILLVEDDEATNFFHKEIINQGGYAAQIQIAQDGLEAIEYLQRAIEGKCPEPELLFLDINMPRLNGWEFLEGYRKIKGQQKSNTVIVMLTTSLNPEDLIKAQTSKEVSGFRNKLLTRKMMEEIAEEYFPDYR